MFTREKTGNEARTDDAGAGHGYFPQQMTPFIVAAKPASALSKKPLPVTENLSLYPARCFRGRPQAEEIYAVGTLANIVQSVKLPDGNIKVLVEGIERARAVSISPEEGFFRATIRLMAAKIEPSPQVDQLVQKVTASTSSSSSFPRASITTP